MGMVHHKAFLANPGKGVEMNLRGVPADKVEAVEKAVSKILDGAHFSMKVCKGE